MKKDYEEKDWEEKLFVICGVVYLIIFVIFGTKEYSKLESQYRENFTPIMSTKTNANEEYMSKDCQHQCECNDTNQQQKTYKPAGGPGLVVALFMVIFIFYITVIK